MARMPCCAVSINTERLIMNARPTLSLDFRRSVHGGRRDRFADLAIESDELGPRRDRALVRRQHDPLHLPIPQGEDGRARRGPGWGGSIDAFTAATELIDRKNRVLKSIFEQGVRLISELERAILAAPDAASKSMICICRSSPGAGRGRPSPRARRARAARGDPCRRRSIAHAKPGHRFSSPSSIPLAGRRETSRVALKGASDIIAERWSEDPAIRSWLREQLSRGSIKIEEETRL